ncbi:MAG: sulfopyruvate decarboxylase subunit beta [Pseudomonadota bacterium]|jgi:sulfopyruvate decarboxylase subunit beta|nr:sulfopyruvate decarboxylase subunit beta [Pseudomonadota bacterium]MEC7094273.1 sulfopyruvate decarboxylase subunit beta [Pseudomonadota bacterium]MEC7485832.1 sulfopyruvate decarboxylase subunit beta [Pseudomonadota bacterium]MEC8310082.1 sulfopyruvate decarboxylase subunit beta [Pseudomonadota bacterium]MEC8539150.1 sulfopyruvate decarboxylase subunit beta [Pseudomonadota bacterium]
MIRSDVLKTLIPLISDRLVVTNIGLPSQEMHLLDDQPTNFYMLGTMGLASSIGLGLALAQDKKVIAIDGDGSVLMNLGTLPTIANNQAPNFILLIIDNGSYGSTGDQTTYAGMKTSLAAVALASGCDHVVECDAADTAAAMEAALAADHATIIISKCESGNIKVPVIEHDPVMIKERFMAEVVR